MRFLLGLVLEAVLDLVFSESAKKRRAREQKERLDRIRSYRPENRVGMDPTQPLPACENCGEEAHPNVPCSYVGGVDRREQQPPPLASDELAVDDSEQLATTARTEGVESGSAEVGRFEDQPIRVPERVSDATSSGTGLGLTLTHQLDHEPQEVAFVITKDMIAEGNRRARERAAEALRAAQATEPGSYVRPERQRGRPIPPERQHATILVSAVPVVDSTPEPEAWSPPIPEDGVPQERKPSRWSILKKKDDLEIEGFEDED